MNPRQGEAVDFNIHDLFGIRLVRPSPRDVQTVGRHLGLPPKGFAGEPALTIRFVDTLPVDEAMRFLGHEDVGFTDHSFVLLRSRNLARARTLIGLDTFDTSGELICETGLPAIPLLRQLINLLMLARGVVPVHAAAFQHEGRGVMVTGWSHGSKTGTLLAFMAVGAKFIGDEWIYLSPERERMYGLPDQLEARPWYLRELPEYQRHVRLADRIRTSLTAGLATMLSPLVGRSQGRNSIGAKMVRRTHEALLDQQSIHLQPLTLFSEQDGTFESALHLVLVTVSQDEPQVLVKPASLELVVGRMAASFLYEQASLIACYQKHLFAFPGRRNATLDQLEQIYRRHASAALAGKEAFTMFHPYPVSIKSLRDAVRPLLNR